MGVKDEEINYSNDCGNGSVLGSKFICCQYVSDWNV